MAKIEFLLRYFSIISMHIKEIVLSNVLLVGAGGSYICCAIVCELICKNVAFNAERTYSSLFDPGPSEC